MAGIKIIGVKVVGICSKCRTEGDEIIKNKFGVITPDKDIACVGCALDSTPKPKQKKQERELIVTQKMCDEMNQMQEKIFGKVSPELKKALGFKHHKPHKVKYLFG